MWICYVIGGCSGVSDKGMMMLCRLGVLIMYKDVRTFVDVHVV